MPAQRSVPQHFNHLVAHFRGGYPLLIVGSPYIPGPVPFFDHPADGAIDIVGAVRTSQAVPEHQGAAQDHSDGIRDVLPFDVIRAPVYRLIQRGAVQ